VPEHGGEHQVTIGDEGRWNAVQVDDHGEEDLGHRLSDVWVYYGNEVAVLEEPVHHGEDHGLAPNLEGRQ
jgi:hypothetical protein